MDLIKRLQHFESGGTVENPKALLREAIAEIDRLRRFARMVDSHIVKRADYVRALENCAPDNTANYWRWFGHAEARRQLLASLPWSPHNDDAERISKAAGVTPS